jgi:hypothetical protein
VGLGPGEWIAGLAALAGFVAWMTAMWIRAGRILQRIDDMADDQLLLKQEVAGHETRITRLEVLSERSRP